jgi:hypothetical protein
MSGLPLAPSSLEGSPAHGEQLLFSPQRAESEAQPPLHWSGSGNPDSLPPPPVSCLNVFPSGLWKHHCTQWLFHLCMRPSSQSCAIVIEVGRLGDWDPTKHFSAGFVLLFAYRIVSPFSRALLWGLGGGWEGLWGHKKVRCRPVYQAELPRRVKYGDFKRLHWCLELGLELS